MPAKVGKSAKKHKESEKGHPHTIDSSLENLENLKC
jgi:hypothetical protein